MVTSIARRISE